MSAFVSRPVLPLAAALALSLAAPADAQSFLKNLAREAAYRAATAAAAGGSSQPAQQQQQVASNDDGGGAPPAPAAEPEAPATPSTGPAPWPLNAGARNIKYPKDLQFAPEYAAQKK